MLETALVGFLGLLGLMALGSREARPAGWPDSRSEAVRRVLRHLARRSIRDLVEGDAAVVRGTASSIAAPLIAPLSGRPCIGYHVQIRLLVNDALVVDHARCTSFAITDATGTVRVRGDGMELAVTKAPMYRTWPPLPPALLQFLPPWWHGQPIRWTEGLLLEGARVAACGVMQTAVIGAALYREAHTSGELIASPTFPLVASPDPDLAPPPPRPYRPEELRG